MNSARVSSEPTTTTFGRVQPPNDAVELRGDVLQVLRDELLDVPLVARLRPAALVVPSRLLLGPVDDLLEPAAAEPEDLPALAPDERDERAVVAADERRERREVEAAADVARRRAPARRPATGRTEVAGNEHGEPARAVAIELVVEELAGSARSPA